MSGARQKQVLLGRIVGAHGIRGDVLIKTYTGAPESIAAYGLLSDADGLRSFKIESARGTAKGVVARVAGVEDRDAAEALKGVELYIDRDRLPAAGEGEFYHTDLIDLAVIDEAGKALGKIVAVQNFGAGDLLEIRMSGTSRTEFIPFTEANVPNVDIAAGLVIVVIPPVTGTEEE